MNLLQAAWEDRKYSQVAQLLDQQRPAAGQPDLRGFEWHYWHRKVHRGRLRSVKVPQLAKPDYFTSGTLNFSRGGARLAAVLPAPIDSSRLQGFGLLAVFDGATGRELFTPLNPFPGWQDDGRGARLLSLSDDGTRLAVAMAATLGSRESTHEKLDRISIRDAVTGTEINSLQSPEFISNIALTPDGRRLAVAYRERGTSGVLGVKVWDTSSGDLIQTLPMLPLGLSPICWSPDGTRLVRQQQIEAGNKLSDAVQLFQVVDVLSGKELWRRTIQNVGNSLNRTWSWSPDGKLLVVAVSGSVETKPCVQLWDSDTGTTLATLDREFESPIRDATIDFSPDGKLLAIVSGVNEIYLWELPALALAAGASPLRIAAPHLTLQTAGEEIRALAFSADSRTLNSVADTSIIVWDATAREDIGTGPDSLRFFGSTRSTSSRSRIVEISTDATKIAFSAIGLSQDFSVWDLAGNRELWRLKSESPSGTGPTRPVFSPDGKRVALFQRDTEESGCQIVFHEVQTGVEVQRIALDKSALTIFGMPVFRPGGSQIAAMIIPQQPQENLARRRLMAWDVVTQKPLFSVNLNENVKERIDAYLMGYSPDGASVIVGHWDASNQQEGGVVFYNAATGELQRSIPVPSALRPGWIDFSGQTIGAVGRSETTMGGIVANAIGSADIVLLDLATGQERLRLRGHDGFDHYALSSDGSRLALGKQPPPLIRGQSELSLWSLKSGQRLLTLKREGSFTAISFSPDGNRLVAAFSGRATDGIKPIQIWDATPLPEEVVK